MQQGRVSPSMGRIEISNDEAPRPTLPNHSLWLRLFTPLMTPLYQEETRRPEAGGQFNPSDRPIVARLGVLAWRGAARRAQEAQPMG